MSTQSPHAASLTVSAPAQRFGKDKNRMKTHRTTTLLTQVAAFGLGLLLLGSATTWAADMCIQNRGSGALYVGKNFAFPAAGTCKPFDGFIANVGGGCVLSGTACGVSNNFLDIRFNLNYSCSLQSFASAGIVGTLNVDVNRLYSGDNDDFNFGYYCQTHGLADPQLSCGYVKVRTIPCGVASVPVD